MDNLLTRTPNTSERLSQYSDESFEVVISPSGTAPPTHASGHVWMPPVFGATISDSNVADWVATTFYHVRKVQEVELDPDSARIFLSPLEAQFLTQIRKDLAELSEPARSSPGAELCRRFTEGVGITLAFVPRARCAVFGDEEDGVELVAHSRASMRQVSFEFGDADDTINIVLIDEEMRRSESKCRINHVLQLKNAIAWLYPH